MAAERAGYTVTMFLVDVSRSMGKTRVIDLPDGPNGEHQSREVTNLEWALQFVLLKIQEMIFNGRKTEQCGVILFGSEETNNLLNKEGKGYDNVEEFIPIGQPNATTLAKLQGLRPSDTTGDPLDAIIVGVDTQDRYLARKPTWTRKLVLITDGESPIEVGDWELTVNKMNSLRVHTTVIGVDFDDEEFGCEEEEKSNIKRQNEAFFHEFVGALNNGVCGTCAFALQECLRPEVKVTKSALIGSVLRLGDVDVRPEEALEIWVKMSKCTAVVRPPTMKRFVLRPRPGEDPDAEQTIEEEMDVDEDKDRKDVYAELKSRTEYYLDHGPKDEKVKPEEDGGDERDDNESYMKTERREKVDQEQLVRGFKYGSTYVPCPEGEFPRLSTRKGIDICGFFPDRNIRRDLGIGEVQYVWADPGSGQQQVVFSSLVQAMLERNVVAIGRWVSRDGMDPKMGLLIPREFERVDCFLWLQMPFADDIRKYTFPSLNTLLNRKGERVSSHPFLPTDEQLEAMDNFVDAMDLMHAGEKDENGERQPWFDPRESYNPAVHRIKQALFHAATATDLRENPLPPPHPEVVKYLEPPQRVIKRAAGAIQECKEAFQIKMVPKKVARKRKDGHVRAEDDDDEELILDQMQKPQTPSYQDTRQSQSNSQTQSVALVGNQKSSTTKKPVPEDSETESESDEELDPTAVNNAADKQLPTPTPESDVEFDDDGDSSSKRIISRARPLADFRKNLKTGDLVSKAVEDLSYVIKDIVMKPFASRRQAEMLECMKILREACLTEDEIDAWNAFLYDLKESCLSKQGIQNLEFWEAVQNSGRSLSLISDKEARGQGGRSSVSEEAAIKFIK